MSQDHFAHKAGTYEQNPDRVDNVANIANAIISSVPLNKAMHLMDFGAGTGLLLARVAPLVARITAVDVSSAMISKLEEKRPQLACELEVLQLDLETADIPQRFDGIISSMTMHHIRDVAAMFGKFFTLVKPGGFIAISDLDAEDGSFHGEDASVYHHGFVPEALGRLATAAGFKDVGVSQCSIIHKDSSDFPVFLLTARR